MDETVRADVEGQQIEYAVEEAIGLICGELNAKPTDFLELEGKWTPELLSTMLPVAIQRRAERNLDSFVCTIRAIMAMLSSKVAKELMDQHEGVQEAILGAFRLSRGLPPLPIDHPAVGRKQKQFMDELDGFLGTGATPPGKVSKRPPRNRGKNRVPKRGGRRRR